MAPLTHLSRALRRAILAACVLAMAAAAGACSDTSNPGAGDAALPDTATADGANFGDTDGTTTDATPSEVDVPPADVPSTCSGCFEPAVCIDGFCLLPEDGGCTPGATDGCVGEDRIRTCNAEGTIYVPTACPKNQGCIDDACRPLICIVGEFICEGLSSKKQCNADGTGFLTAIPCAEGEYCQSGKCGSSCQIDPKFGSYVGCAFWTVDLPNYPDPFSNPTPEDLPYGLVVSNPGELLAEVSFETPPGVTVDAPDTKIPGRTSRIFLMPVLNVSLTGTSMKGIRVSSTRPVLVHQFNPWDNEFSNDASLLLPETFLGSQYTILSWPSGPSVFPNLKGQSGYFTVLAAYAATDVTIMVTADVLAGGKVKAMKAGTTQTIRLERGEVMNIEMTADFSSVFGNTDLTGSTVTSDKPVAVFAGHEEAVIAPQDAEESCCADHLEEQMLPKSVLGTHYLAVKLKPRGGESDYWRIQAADDNVTFSTNPPLKTNGSSPKTTTNLTLKKRGDWVEIVTPDSFEIDATGLLQVGQYMVSQAVTDDFIGDPSLILLVPETRFRSFYVLAVPSTFSKNYITIVKQPGETAMVDGVAVPQSDFKPVASGLWERAYVLLTPGVHDVSGSAPFGLTAYGYSSAASYGYIGGIGDSSE
ncbi:MAG: IgGFc-binding protein [Myxococcota bacterium]